MDDKKEWIEVSRWECPACGEIQMLAHDPALKPAGSCECGWQPAPPEPEDRLTTLRELIKKHSGSVSGHPVSKYLLEAVLLLIDERQFDNRVPMRLQCRYGCSPTP